MRLTFLLAAMTLTCACQMQAETPPDDTYGASAFQLSIGGPLPLNLPTDRPVRVYREGNPVTMDYSAERLNITLDTATGSRVVSVSCG